MRYLDYIRRCNRYDPAEYVPFILDGVVLGRVRRESVGLLTPWKALFRVTPESLELIGADGDLQQRSRPLQGVLQELAGQGVLGPLTGEPYAVTAGERDQALLLIDRAAAPFFGIRAFGQHINGLVRSGGELKMWVGRRASDRVRFPGKLDHLVAGGVPYGITLAENLIKECWEEAGIPRALAERAVPVGTVTYLAESQRGLKPDILYCYDLELPGDFQPRCTDGEVEGFQLWTIRQVMETLLQGDSFKLNCNLVIIDFLIRHGYLGPQDEGYLDLVTGLHPTLP